jgi:aspartate/methionine/tyrosine aminotransferase
VSTPIQYATPQWLALRPFLQKQIHSRVTANLDFFQAQLANHTCGRALRTEGGWYAVLKLPSLRHEEELVLQFLEHDDLLVHPGYFFDFSDAGCLVLSLLPSPEIFREGIARLLASIQKA